MKWSEQLTAKLKELCYQEKSNKEIATILKCAVTDIYAKRSQLGITIDKCKEKKEFQKLGKAPKPKEHLGLHKNVNKAFATLYDEILLAMASDWTSGRDATLYAGLAEVIFSIQESYNASIRSSGKN